MVFKVAKCGVKHVSVLYVYVICEFASHIRQREIDCEMNTGSKENTMNIDSSLLQELLLTAFWVKNNISE